MVGIPLMFVYICVAVGDPVILKGLLGSHFVYICLHVGDPVI
jgi:hypothetical protein